MQSLAINRYAVAKSFIEAIKIITTSDLYAGREVMLVSPTQNLAANGLELYLKAWLLGSGVSSTDVRAIGHNLARLHSDAQNQGLPDIVGLGEAIKLLERPHVEHHYRYLPENATIQTINWALFFGLADRLNEVVDKMLGASVSHGLQPGH